MNAPEVDPVVPWPGGSVVVGWHGGHRDERRYPARSAEAVVHVLVPEAIYGEVFAALDVNIGRPKVLGRHDHALTDANRAVAAATCRDVRAREFEADRAAVATGVVGLRVHGSHAFTKLSL